MGKRNQGSQNGQDATPPVKSLFQRGGIPYASHSHDPQHSTAHQTAYYQDRSRYAHQTPPLGIYGQYPQYQAMNRAPYSYGTHYGHAYGYSDFSPSGSRALYSDKGRENRASMSSYNQDYPDQRERFLVDNDNKDDSEEGSEDGEAVDRGGKFSSLRTDKAREIVDLSVPSLFPNLKAPHRIDGSFLSGVDLSFKVESSAKVAYEEMLATGKEVTLWKVVQTILASLKVSSLESLGVNLHDVPCLKKLMLLEGKVNAFIHCHVAVRRITTLHDLEQELCQSEGVENFSQLGLGPLLVHPLVVHYFDPPALTEVYKITAEDVMHDLSAFLKKSRGQMLQVENFVSFMIKKRSLASPKHLCVRIQSFGMYVSSLRQEMKADVDFSKRHLSIIRARTRAESESAPAPVQSQLTGIINRVEDFLASTTSDQHASRVVRYLDVSSDDEDKDRKSRSGSGSTGKFHASRCPYPSAAEEQARLVQEIPPDLKHLLAEPDFTLSKQELQDFIGTWKDVCHTNSVLEVFTRMLHVSGSEKGQMISKKKKRQQAKLFKTYPAIGLLNVAVMSMRIGHWDSMYDALVDATVENLQQATETPSAVIDVGSAPKSMPIIKDEGPSSGQVLEDLLNLISEANIGNHTSGGTKEKHLSLWVRRLLKSEHLLTQKYGVSSFPSLKLGNFSDFVEQHWEELSDKIMLDSSEENSGNCGITALPDHHLDAFIYQVALALKDDENLSEEALVKLIIRQFNIPDGEKLGHRACDKLAKFLDCKKRGEIAKKSISFAAALIGTDQISDECTRPNLMMQTKEEDGENNTNYRVGHLGMMDNSDAIECFQKMPLLYDLAKWSHWDLVFAPTLGPLLDWLESYGGLECIVTCEGGGIIRINGSISVDDFLSAILKERYEEVASSIVSLVAKYGGVRHAPMTLLKSHAEKGLKILAMNTYDGFDDNILEKKRKLQMFESDAKGGLASWRAVKLVLCSLMQVPLDFQAFAEVVLVPALASVVPDAQIALLKACRTVGERSVLHKIGMLVGISEWIDDFRLLLKESSSGILNSKGVGIEGNLPVSLDKDRVTSKNAIKYDDSDQVDVISKDDRPQKKKRVDINSATKHIHDEGMHDVVREQEHHSHALARSGWMLTDSMSKQEENEARDVIDQIRREEFGLDLDLEGKEGRLLSKQHARIGRALHCLSRELYSQDSHFVLELVQNADDNQYKSGVEAGLVFLIQRNRIVVMNNEIGFTAANMKALCDVGNSTKVGSAAGYIGHKGIGFKSVFRVTDAPEIHSRGFRVKFDISEGNLGFILPTLVPPVTDTHSIAETLSAVDKKVGGMEKSCWATCLILPLKPSVAGGPEFELLASKFNDIHPSLLLFLHRLRCIAIRNDASDAMRLMRRVDLENGLVKVENGDTTATWLVVGLKLKAAAQRPGVETTEIALAFPLHEVEEGGYKACCEQQYVFSFLPLRPYGLKFIIQGDFILPSSREEVDSDSAWNQWLISEIPKACMEAVFAFRKLEYFQNNPGKAATALMSYMPLEGEIQGFFSPLPRMLISVLRTTECLPCEDANGSWNLPCVLVGGWNDFDQKLIPGSLLKEHLGLMYLHRDVKLNSFLAASLGVHNFGASILVDLMRSLCKKKGALVALGPTWVGCWLVSLYKSTQSSKEKGYMASHRRRTDDIYKELQSLAFIPLGNGTLTSVADGPVWLPSGIEEPGRETKVLLEKFPLIYSELRIIHPSLLAIVELEDFKSTLEAGEGVATALEFHSLVCTMLQRIGVGRVLAHDIMYSHILPSMGSNSCLEKDRGTLLQYLSFIIFHLRSDCRDCNLSRSALIKQFQEKLLLSTNNGYKRVGDEPLHFCAEFGCPVQAKQIIQGTGVKWNEVDFAYLEIVLDGSKDTLLSWRMFLKELGVTDFVQLVQVKKRGCELMEVDDWESPELIELFEGLSHGNIQIQERVNQCGLLLLALDKLWEECYSCCQVTVDADNQEMVSSFILTLRRFQWVLSSLDGELHYPTELFHRCYAVESIFGCHAPYASPQVQSKGLVSALGLRTHVTTQDALAVLRSWTQQGRSFKASVGQMMRLYSFIWSQATSDQEEILQFFKSGSFIFLPTILKSKNGEEISEGFFFMLDEVYWEDKTGCVDFVMKSKHHTKEIITSTPFRTLKLVYPSMYGFFVDVLGIRESLCFSEHIVLLKSLAGMSSPHESWKQAMNILQKWSCEIQANDVNSEDVSKWKELLQDAKNTVLPTLQDKWVALDSSMALICWCDDDDLGKQFLNSGRVYFVLNGCIELLISPKDAKGTGILKCPDISAFLKAMNIPPLSEVVDREPIVYGAESSSQFQELLKWVLPYVQRFLRHFYPENYKCLQKTLFSNGFKHLHCLVADEIYFRYKLPGSLASGSKRIKCDYLLQGDTFYVTGLENMNAMFLEFSRLFFHGKTNLQLANFLHLITLSAHSGSDESEVEVLVSGSQGIPPLPLSAKADNDEEPCWRMEAMDARLQQSNSKHHMEKKVILSDDPITRKAPKRFANSVWPPQSWHTAPGMPPPRNKMKGGNWPLMASAVDSHLESAIVKVSSSRGKTLFSAISETNQRGEHMGCNEFLPEHTSGNVGGEVDERDQLQLGQPSEQRQELTGRLGESLVFHYLLQKYGADNVTWLNETVESGSSFDFRVKKHDGHNLFIEVKATRSADKDWFEITKREWELASQEGENFVVIRVFIAPTYESARLLWLPDPVRLFDERIIKLAIVIPQLQSSSLAETLLMLDMSQG